MSTPQIIFAAAVFITGCTFLTLWMSVIRPYLFKKKGYHNGFKWGFELWTDWEEAYDLAKQSGDTRIRVLCVAYFVFFVLYILAVATAPIWYD